MRQLSNILSALFLCLAGQSVLAANCFERHILDAIKQNADRAPLYSKASNGQSSEISRRLILGEHFSRWASKIYYDFDKRAEPYQAKGMTIMCDEFADMALSPAFGSLVSEQPPSLASYKVPPSAEFRKNLRAALKTEGFAGVVRVAREALQQIEHEKRFNCMTRHVLESVIRVAALAPGHVARAKELGLPSPEQLSRDLLESHWIALPMITDLDVRAAPLQARGLPIVCQDVPPIPLP